MTIETGGSPDYWPQIITGISGLVGALIGAGASLLGQHVSRKSEAGQKRKAIAYALAAEIEASLSITERRGLISLAQRQADLARNGQPFSFKGWVTDEERKRDPFPIFTANMSNIGLLGTSCSEIGTFYNHAAAVRLTILAFQDGEYSGLSSYQMVKLIEEEIDLWIETAASGRRLIGQLRAIT